MSGTKSGASQGIRISKEDFLRAVFGDIEQGEEIVYVKASETGYPSYAWRDGENKVPGRATHFCPMTMRTEGIVKGMLIERRNVHASQAYVIVADDIGTVEGKSKVKPAVMAKFKLKPSWTLETSPGNFQFGWILEDPIAPVDYKRILVSFQSEGATDDGTVKVTQVFRLPGSVKPEAEKPFPARVDIWEPGRRYTLAQFEDAFGGALKEASFDPEEDRQYPALEPDILTEWIMDQEWYDGTLEGGKFERIVCPWAHEHSDGKDWAYYVSPHEGDSTHGFDCKHGHCHGRGGEDFVRWCLENGAPAEIGARPDVTRYYTDPGDLAQLLARAPAAPAEVMDRILKAPRALDEAIRPESRREKAKREREQEAEEVQAEEHDEQDHGDAPTVGMEKVTLDVTDPNFHSAKITLLESYLAEDEVAFLYGGVPVTMKRSPSAKGRVPRLDRRGRPVLDDQGETIMDPAKVVKPTPIDRGTMFQLLRSVAYFETVKQTQTSTIQTPVDPPASLVTEMMSTMGEQLPPVSNVANHPVWFRGDLLFKDGYHADSQMFLQTGGLEIETFESAEAAYRFLRHDWLGDYPFAREEDAVAALTIPLTLLCAKTLLQGEAGPPMIMVTAPQAGTGKTWLAMQLVMAVTGELPSSTLYPETEIERAKTVTSSIMEGASYVIFDNIRSASVLGNGHRVLTKLVTDLIWEDRVLGASKNYSGPASLVPITTGNNLTAAGDLARRTIECRLSNPEGVHSANRSFKRRSPLKWTQAHRGRILGALATILRAGGEGVVTQGTFPGWARHVAAPLVKVSGATEFFEPWVEAAEADADGHATKGVQKLFEAMARMADASGEPQPMSGAWFTADEVRKGCVAEIIEALPDGTEITTETVLHLLKRNRDVRLDDAFTLRADRRNLGNRTGRKPRWCFKVVRSKKTDGELTTDEATNKIVDMATARHKK